MRIRQAFSRFTTVSASTLLVGTLGGCNGTGPFNDTPSPRDLSAPPPVALPDITQLQPSVQEQIRSRHAVLRQAENRSTTERGDAYGELGSILTAAGYNEVAEAAYLNAYSLSPDALRWPYYLAHLYRQQGKSPEAAEFFERSLAIDTEYVPAHLWLGEMYLDLGRPADAEPLFDNVRTRQPGSAAAWYGVGRAALAQQDTTRALEALERALDLDHDASSVHYSLGVAYRTAGDLLKAQQHFAQRGDVTPAFPDPLRRVNAGLLQSALAFESRGMQEMNAGRFAEAAAIFRNGLRVTPDDPQLRHRLGAALMFGGDPAGAQQELERVLSQTPDFEQAHFSLAVLASMNGRPEEAIERYSTALQHRPNYLEARLGLADELRSRGHLEGAHAQFSNIVEQNPPVIEAWMLGAITLIELSRYSDAREWLQRARLVHPGHPDLTDLLARILAAAPDARIRDGALARTLIQERIETPPTIEFHETLAMVLAETGQFDEAVAWQQRAISGARAQGQTTRLPFMERNLARYTGGTASREPLERQGP